MPFNIGGSELLLILIVALVVFGPQRLPDLMRQAARVWRQLQQFSNDMQGEFRRAVRELDLEEGTRPEHPPGYDPATHSVPYQPPDIPHQYVPPPATPGTIEPLAATITDAEAGTTPGATQETDDAVDLLTTGEGRV